LFFGLLYTIYCPARMSYLLCIETANPRFAHSQQAVTDFYCSTATNGLADVTRKIKAVSARSGISQRFSVMNDFSLGHADYEFFPKNQALEPVPGLDKRMALFKKEALALSLEAVGKMRNFEAIRDRITHIITVTCTGLFAPGLDIELMKQLGLRNGIHRSSVNFMGCNAAMLALKQADQICRSHPGSLVLVVCTELCTLHFQKDFSDDYILSNLLFGDGCAAALVGSQPVDQMTSGYPVKIDAFQSLIVHEGVHDMAWQLSDRGFIMNLSSYVSGLLNKNIAGMLRENGISREQISHWAIHPGGKKILDEFCTSMTLDKAHLSCSYEVLRDYGNMSSATILFVLKELLNKKQLKANDKIFTAAFGPGLSIESAVLQYV
jgi:alpha-pyrone synthase